MMFSRVSISLMVLSLSGLAGFSALTSWRMRFLIASAATVSPSTVATAVEKKYFSSKMPWGQCTYLFEVTRLTVDSCMPMSSATSRRMSGRIAPAPRSKNSRWNLSRLSITR